MDTLTEYYCPRCNKSLVWTFENATVQCNHCFRIIKAKNLKVKKTCSIEYSNGEEQLSIF